MIPELYRVTERRIDAADTVTLAARPLQERGFSFLPGQFNMLYAFGKGEIPISISGCSETTDSVVHTIQSVGAVSQALTSLEPGDTFGLRGPFGRGWPVQAAEGGDLVLLAGGLGLAPLRPVVYYAMRHRERFSRVVLLYGARSRDRLLYESELHEWRTRFDMEVLVTLDLASPDWHGHVGVVTGLVAAAGQLVDLGKAACFVCGPPIMMRYAVRELQRQGAHPAGIYLSMERNMKCALGVCGHCQFGPVFLCRDGPVFAYSDLEPWMAVAQL